MKTNTNLKEPADTENNIKTTSDLLEFAEFIEEWYEKKVGMLKLIIKNDSATIQIGDTTFDAEDRISRGIRLGIILALDLIGELPFSNTNKKR